MLVRSLQFAFAAFVVVLGVDALFSFVFQAPPASERRTSFFVAHGLFLTAVFVLSTIGALVAFATIRRRLPSARVALVVGGMYGLVTVLSGPGMLMLAGVAGAAGWLALGSMAFALGTGLFSGPWRRPAI
jgi:hypothetical protein